MKLELNEHGLKGICKQSFLVGLFEGYNLVKNS